MARNEEKQFGKLNRLYLQKEKEDQALRNPKRPKLNHLNTVNDIKQWLPSIKRDIDFNLKQSQVICYSDDKVTELHEEVTKLEKEYKSFVRKIKQVNSSIHDIPWTNRPYERQHKCDTLTTLENHGQHHISTPLTENIEKKPIPDKLLWNCDVNKQDLPLEFNSEHRERTMKPVEKKSDVQLPLKEFSSQCVTHRKLAKIFNICSDIERTPVDDSGPNDKSVSSSNCNKTDSSIERFDTEKLGDYSQITNNSWSGLDYSSSSDES